MSARLTREDVARIVADARMAGAMPDLSGLDLRGLNLSWLNLRGTNLHRTDMRRANLRSTDLYGTNLRGTNLRRAHLERTMGGILSIPSGIPSGRAILRPLADVGWWLNVGCWEGTIPDLRELIDGKDWPSASNLIEIDRRRPILRAVADLADAHAAYHAVELAAVQELWGQAA